MVSTMVHDWNDLRAQILPASLISPSVGTEMGSLLVGAVPGGGARFD